MSLPRLANYLEMLFAQLNICACERYIIRTDVPNPGGDLDEELQQMRRTANSLRNELPLLRGYP